MKIDSRGYVRDFFRIAGMAGVLILPIGSYVLKQRWNRLTTRLWRK